MISKYRVESTEYRALVQKFKFYILSFAFALLLVLNFTFNSYAEELTILYTGDTHAMLYHCNCPKEPDGGVARRATLVKKLRGENSSTLLLDSGGFFAGGIMDEYTQNTQLDTQRTLINLKAMELMKYDAVAIGDDEFNFGQDFLLENIAKSNLNFVSSNLKLKGVKPYIIKEIGNIRIGIVGLTNMAAEHKVTSLKLIEAKVALQEDLRELKKAKVDMVILISHLGESDDLKLIGEVPGIDVLISGYTQSKEGPFSKVGSTLLLRPSWQGRRLGKATLDIENKKIVNSKVEEIRLSDDLGGDSDILSLLPVCFSDANCKKEGFIGSCEQAGALEAKCNFRPAAPINLVIITPKVCPVCYTQTFTNYLKGYFPGLVVSYIYYPASDANKKIKEYGIWALPAYLLGKEVKKENIFDNFKDKLEEKKDFYLLKPTFTGISYYLQRKKIPGRFDLFITLFDKNIGEVLERVKEFKPNIHFLVVEQKSGFEAAKGNFEIEEYLRSVCVQRYYPGSLWEYLECRSKNIDSSWWDSCLESERIEKIKTCALSGQAKDLLRENISLNKELSVMFGPTYLLDNQEIFSGLPSKEEFKKIMDKR